MSEYALRILDRQKEVYSEEHDGELELGRQQPNEAGPYHRSQAGTTQRLVIAPIEERKIARRQLMVRPREEGRLELSNLSSVSTVSLVGGEPIPPGATALVNLPARLVFTTDLELVFDYSSSYVELNSLAMMTMRPGASIGDISEFFSEQSRKPQTARDSEDLIRALEMMMDVFQMASTASDFYLRACKAAVDLVGLDSGRILLPEGEKWKVVQTITADKAETGGVSRYVVNQVLRHKKTFWNSGFNSQRPSESLGDVQAVVAAPVLTSGGEVIGILYGERLLNYSPEQRQVVEMTQLHALLLELVACAVASGLARLKGEDAARRLRLQFEQFFTPTLAQHLESHPDMLNGRDANVTVLFGDIRGFSRIAEKIGAARTFDWINDVMGALSESVLKHNGVLVDYIGDELMAMWGAPEEQPDHARRACQAAIDMIEMIPSLNERWKSVLDVPFDIGIGINSGPVRAGNMGSHRKFKYGPLGNTVNLASRVQGATKYLKSRLIVTGSTAEALGQDFLMRRVADVRVVNIDQPVKLYELPCGRFPNASDICRKYEQALEFFEKRDFREAARMLTTLLTSELDDGPSVILLSRAVQAMVEGAGPQHPVWQLPGK
ncbi:MAG: adenylate/guanylate cyclase domain-containing protein [Planctomycetes bacterium]|nr:adenylate/guanylate cyclase domain-containing protein [Planctomycetota bacterium]